MLGGYASEVPPAHLSVVHATPGPLPSVHLPQQHLEGGTRAAVYGALVSTAARMPNSSMFTCLYS